MSNPASINQKKPTRAIWRDTIFDTTINVRAMGRKARPVLIAE